MTYIYHCRLWACKKASVIRAIELQLGFVFLLFLRINNVESLQNQCFNYFVCLKYLEIAKIQVYRVLIPFGREIKVPIKNVAHISHICHILFLLDTVTV